MITNEATRRLRYPAQLRARLETERAHHLAEQRQHEEQAVRARVGALLALTDAAMDVQPVVWRPVTEWECAGMGWHDLSTVADQVACIDVDGLTFALPFVGEGVLVAVVGDLGALVRADRVNGLVSVLAYLDDITDLYEAGDA